MENQIEIICPSFGRTGTTSLEVALEYLGFDPVYSYFNCIKNGRLFSEWKNIYYQDDPRIYLTEHIRNFKVISDFPICIFGEFIIKNNPQAKVILTTRDEEAWSKSIVRLYNLCNVNTKMVGIITTRIQNVLEVFNKQVWPVIFEGGELGDPLIAIKNYHKHLEKIRLITNPENLLEFNVKQGWEPLVRFLGIDEIPKIPFPYVNKGINYIQYNAFRLAIRRF